MYSLTYTPDIPVKCSFTCSSGQMFKNTQSIVFCNKKGKIISHLSFNSVMYKYIVVFPYGGLFVDISAMI